MMRGIRILRSCVPSARKINAPRRCCRCLAVQLQALLHLCSSLLASGAAAGQRDAALFPLTVASVDSLPASRRSAWGPFKALRICSTPC